jgi:hypothetical protein
MGVFLTKSGFGADGEQGRAGSFSRFHRSFRVRDNTDPGWNVGDRVPVWFLRGPATQAAEGNGGGTNGGNSTRVALDPRWNAHLAPTHIGLS